MNHPSTLQAVDWLSYGASFLLVLLLIFGLFQLIKRMGGATPARRLLRQITVIESQMLDTRQRVALVRVKDREILLGLTQQQISLLASWPSGEDDNAAPQGEAGAARSAAPVGAGLRQLLQGMQARGVDRS